MTLRIATFGSILLLGLCSLAMAAPKLLDVSDWVRLQRVSDPQLSPDGNWVAYTVAIRNANTDGGSRSLWMVSWDGAQSIQLTQGTDSASDPRWSPDGRYLAFLSSRVGKAPGTQVWVLDRHGGEARQLTEVHGHLSDSVWAPDLKRLALVLKEDDGTPHDDTRPIVIDRYVFKSDSEGYLTGTARSRIYLLDLATQQMQPLTTASNVVEHDPAWSPDGTLIAFSSNRAVDPDRSNNTDIYVAPAAAGSEPRKLTTFAGPDEGPLSWSPDGRRIAYLQGSRPEYSGYNMSRLALIDVSGGRATLLTSRLDRDLEDPRFTPDGRFIQVLVEDDRSVYPARVPVGAGEVQRLIRQPIAVGSQTRVGDRVAVLAATDDAPAELYAVEGGELRKLTHHNDAWLGELHLGATEEMNFLSRDGTAVHGLVLKPPTYQAGVRYPTLLRIHGGPYGQDTHAFSFENQLFAAHGYVVLGVNYRGSSGRGEKFGQGIFRNWGSKDVEDVLAGVDAVVKSGLADPDRLGIGGWSYGGNLTDFVISHDKRFKAAIAGAGFGNDISMYGVNQYVFKYDREIGRPWEPNSVAMKYSYPFFHAGQIQTPTLFMGGDKDFNVPLVGSEQMYQALKSLNVPTQLVIYPGEHHGLGRTRFILDRYERYLAWYDRYLATGAR